MKKYDTPLEDLYVIEPNIIKDSRGFFMNLLINKSLMNY
jgi:dTDP-4-dehydrorhamnose 3,5-epimerase-like enzyme